MKAEANIVQSGPVDLARLRITDLCALLECPRSSIHLWLKAGMPRREDKTFDLYAVLPWLRKRWVSEYREEAATDKGSPALEAFRQARADLAALDLEERRAGLVSAIDVAHEWTRVLTELKNNLIGLPNRLAPRLKDETNPRRIAQVMDDAIREALNKAAARIVKGRAESKSN